MLNVNRWVNNHNLFKSVETPTSGDHVEHKNSSFFPSSSFPPHRWEVQFIPWCMAFSHLWWMAASLPRQADSSPDKGFPPMCSLHERPLPYLDKCPPLLMNNFLSGSPPLKCPPSLLWWLVSQPPPYLNKQSPPSPLPGQMVSSFLQQMTSSLNEQLLFSYEDAAWGLWSGDEN